MSNLVPTPRLDKNGRTVIRHMKGQRPSSSSALPLPPVVTEVNHSQLVSEAATFISSAWTADYQIEHYYQESRTVLTGYAPDTMHRIMGNLSASHMNLLAHGFTMEWDEAKINDYISIAAAIESNGVHSEELGWHLQSFAYYKDLTPIQPGQPYPLKRAAQCSAIVDTVIAVQENVDEDDEDSDGAFTHMEDGEFLPFIQDPKLHDLILHSEEREAAVGIIKVHRIFDADLILEILSSDTPAISEGML